MAAVLIPLAQGCEELEAVTVIDLLRRAGIEVVTAGLDNHPVRASRGVVLIPDTCLDEALKRDYDMVVLPGGAQGAEQLNRDPRVHDLLIKMAANGKFTAAICAAPKVLGSAGLLTGKRATGYPGILRAMNFAGRDGDRRRPRSRREGHHLARTRHGDGFRARLDRVPGRHSQSAMRSSRNSREVRNGRRC